MSRKMQRGKRINYNEILRNPTKPKNDVKDNKNEAPKVNEPDSKINKEVAEASHDQQYTNRKYIQYGIKVTYLNGEVRNLDLKKQRIDASKFKKVIKYYNKFKKTCQQVDKIEFIGITKQGKEKVIFFKDIKYINQINNPYENMKTLELMKEMSLMIQALKSQDTKSLQRIQLALEKKQDIILHQIEHFDLGHFDNEKELKEQNRLFNKLKEIRNERRQVKNNILLIENFNKQINLSNIEDQINTTIKSYNHKNNKIRYLTDKLVEELKMMKEIPYKTIEQSKIIKQQVQGDYDRIINDELNHKLYCYNNAKQTW